jgi:hypothetical protein
VPQELNSVELDTTVPKPAVLPLHYNSNPHEDRYVLGGSRLGSSDHSREVADKVLIVQYRLDQVNARWVCHRAEKPSGSFGLAVCHV